LNIYLKNPKKGTLLCKLLGELQVVVVLRYPILVLFSRRAPRAVISVEVGKWQKLVVVRSNMPIGRIEFEVPFPKIITLMAKKSKILKNEVPFIINLKSIKLSGKVISTTTKRGIVEFD